MEGTLEQLIKVIKDHDPKTFGNLFEKPLRLFIDEKYVVEIESIELLPRTTDVTLMIKSKMIHGNLHLQEITHPESREMDSYEYKMIDPEMITKEKVLESFNAKKEEDDKRSNRI